MTDRELMQQALDALEAMQSYAAAEKKGLRICDEAIEALRNRLEKWTADDTAYRPGGLPQEEQELVAWSRVNMNDHKEGDLGIGTVKWDASAPLVVHPHPAFQATQPQQHSEQWWRHEVSNAWAEGYEKGKVFCACGDQIMPNDNAECGNCVTARNAVKPQPVAQVHVAEDYHPHVIWAEGINAACFDQEYLYAAPPQREWQGLTDEERYLNEARSAEEIEYAKAIEAKLKEKNT